MTLLAGMTVLEIGFMVAAPGAGRILADLGATVIKVEPLTGDVGRRLFPAGDISVMFENNNRGKQSLALDLRTEDGQAVFGDLLDGADVVVTNLRPAFLGEVGVTWEAIHARNPRVVLGNITSFGLDDEESGAAGGDVVAQAESGLTAFQGEPDGAPLIGQHSPADAAGAIFSVVGLLAAYVDAQRNGVGRLVDVSLTDVFTSLDIGVTPMVAATGGAAIAERTGRFHPSITPHGVFRARDGYVVISAYGAGAHSMWPRLAAAIGRPELGDAEGYRTDAERTIRRDEIVGLIELWLDRFPASEDAVRELRSRNVIAARVVTPHERVSSARARRRRMVATIDHPRVGALDVMGLPLRISDFEPALGPAPELGADTAAVLADRLGYDHDRIAALAERGVIALQGDGP